MRLYIVSDLHLETGPSWSIPAQLPEFDVAVIAGDLHCPVARSIEEIASAPVFQGKPDMIVSDHGTEFTSNAMLALGAGEPGHLALNCAGQAHAKRLLRKLQRPHA